MSRPAITPTQSASIARDFERMNEARQALPTLRDDIGFAVRCGLFLALLALLMWLTFNLFADAGAASAAQTEACRPDCAVGPYHQEMPR